MLWYALHVRSCQEHSVAAKLTGEGIEAFYPFVLKPSSAGRRESEQRMMPGYVFAKFDILNKTPVIAIPEVAQILGFGTHAVSIPNSEIESVKLIVSVPKLVCPSDYVSTGDQVRVRRGPLTGLEGYVVYRKNSCRVVVSVTMLARSISAEVDAMDLEILPQSKAA